ncbi:hypothetical protein C8F04DRAFT_1183108 [Mycena alexandri]|uniref:Uncharacterized protein n=1 Tax=Mycena alexandri TaxID=1745969 RepID=A0AAD6X4H6_9AGAR|nr:hypothetical protein C8F04DRAFT_1183108 [Mycena alexandri]
MLGPDRKRRITDSFPLAPIPPKLSSTLSGMCKKHVRKAAGPNTPLNDDASEQRQYYQQQAEPTHEPPPPHSSCPSCMPCCPPRGRARRTANPSAWLLALPSPPHSAYTAFRAFPRVRMCACRGWREQQPRERAHGSGGAVAAVLWEILAPLHMLFDTLVGRGGWGAVRVALPRLAGRPHNFPLSSGVQATTMEADPHPRPRADDRPPPAPRAWACAVFMGAVLECVVSVLRRGRERGLGSKVGGGAVEDVAQARVEGVEGKAGMRLFAQEVGRVWVVLGGGCHIPMAWMKQKLQKTQTQSRSCTSTRGGRQGWCAVAGGAGGDLLAAGLTTLTLCLLAGGPPALICVVLEELVGSSSAVQAYPPILWC